MEYKYAVRNGDGKIATWKPGDNFSLRIPLDEQLAVLPERVEICDAWDNSYRKMEASDGCMSYQPQQPAPEVISMIGILTKSAFVMGQVELGNAARLAAGQEPSEEVQVNPFLLHILHA